MKLNVLNIFLFIAMFPLLAQAAGKSYSLNLELSLKGKSMGPEKIILKDGEKKFTTRSTADGHKIFLEAQAEEKLLSGKKAIRMNFTMGEIAPNGTQTVLDHFHIIANENQEAKVSVNEDNSSIEKLSLKITAKEIAP